MPDSSPAVNAEACPPPLAWQEVVESFLEQARAHQLQLDAGALTVWEFGVGRPLAFFPAQAGGPLLFALTAWLLKDDFRCLLFDHPHWRRRPRPRDLAPRTADCWSMGLEYLAPAGVDLYASQFGSQVALRILADHPRRVRRAVLQAGWSQRQLTRFERLVLQAGLRWPGTLRRAPLWQGVQMQNHRRWFPPFDETRFGFLISELSRTRVRDLSHRMLASQYDSLGTRLGEIRQPTLILHCEGDGQRIEQAQRELERILAGAAGESMTSTGHFPHLTHPHRLVKILKSFLADEANPA